MEGPNLQLIRTTLHRVIRNQIRDGDPPETGETFDRLLGEGIPEEHVWRLLSAVILMELNDMLKSNRPFDRAEYVGWLKALPELPLDE